MPLIFSKSMITRVKGFTLIELLVVISIIGLLSSIVYASFETARQQSRDKTRMAALKEMQLGIELYKAQTGSYPLAGCVGSVTDFSGPGPRSLAGYVECPVYVVGLVPSYVPSLATDPKFETVTDKGFYYRSDGLSYKLMTLDSAETLLITSYNSDFARCPKIQSPGSPCSGAVPANTYAVYSAGAEAW